MRHVILITHIETRWNSSSGVWKISAFCWEVAYRTFPSKTSKVAWKKKKICANKILNIRLHTSEKNSPSFVKCNIEAFELRRLVTMFLKSIVSSWTWTQKKLNIEECTSAFSLGTVHELHHHQREGRGEISLLLRFRKLAERGEWLPSGASRSGFPDGCHRPLYT